MSQSSLAIGWVESAVAAVIDAAKEKTATCQVVSVKLGPRIAGGIEQHRVHVDWVNEHDCGRVQERIEEGEWLQASPHS